jgi:hypothetical protein
MIQLSRLLTFLIVGDSGRTHDNLATTLTFTPSLSDVSGVPRRSRTQAQDVQAGHELTDAELDAVSGGCTCPAGKMPVNIKGPDGVWHTVCVSG